MSDQTDFPPEGTEPETPPTGGKVDDGWQEVGRQFQQLGQALSQAFRTAWEGEENQRRVEGMKNGLESMVQSISQAFDETASSPQGQRVKAEAERTVEVLRTAGEQTVQEVRPQLIDALQQVNAELQKFINRMETGQTTPPPSDPTSTDPGAQA